MSPLSWEASSPENVLSLSSETNALAINKFALVSLREISLSELRLTFSQFKAELTEALIKALGKLPEEFSGWHMALTRKSFKFKPEVMPRSCCVAFKRIAASNSKFHYLQYSPILAAATSAGALPSLVLRGNRKSNQGKDPNATLVAWCQALPVTDQRKLLEGIFRENEISQVLDVGQANTVDFSDLETNLSSAQSAETVLMWLASELGAFDANLDRGSGKGQGLRYAAPWFLLYLARSGALLFPRLKNSENLLPGFLKPLLWDFFAPSPAQSFASALIRQCSSKEFDYASSVFRELLLHTNFFARTDFSPDVPHLLHLKERYSAGGTSPNRKNTAKQHGTNIAFAKYIAYFGKTFLDVGETSAFFGGYQRPNTSDARDAFGWVTHPDRRKNRAFAKVVGYEQPSQFSEVIVEWAKDLRQLLPLFGVKDVKQKIDGLNDWLFFLITLGEEAPTNWMEVDRERHINSYGFTDSLTFVDFLRTKVKGARVNKSISTLRQAWSLAATRDGFQGKIPCPINAEFDFTESTYERGYVTSRRSMPLNVYNIIVDELRKGDFALARASGNYNRIVTDPDTGEHVEIFWPATPCILENILTYGPRHRSAQWLDSGEGDDFWFDEQTLEPIPNPLPTRTKGRRASFLRPVRTNPRKSDVVLGIFFPVSKTGQYEVAISEESTVRNFYRMRELQIKYNRIPNAILATESNINKKHSQPGTFETIFPVFRDVRSRSGLPPTQEAVRNLWKALLTHCQPIVDAEMVRLREEPVYLVINGKTCWDIHALRVTTATILLDFGVDPRAVQELLGHKSLAMTEYYWARDVHKVHVNLQAGFERRRNGLIESLKEASTNEETDALLRKLEPELYCFRADNVGLVSLMSAMRNEASGQYEVYSHGVCPGGDCRTGGRLYHNAYQPVWRPRACSECRYRVTGPAFLPGLIHRLNSLMVEIKSSMDKEADLNREIEEAESDGTNTNILQGLVRTAREKRDNLYGEWCAELHTVQNCQAMEQAQQENPEPLPVVTRMSEVDLATQLSTVHQLTLMNSVLADGQVITGASYEVPAGLRDSRDMILLEVARLNDIGQMFLSLPSHRRRRALDHFGALLDAHTAEHTALQSILDGSTSISDMPALELALQEMTLEGVAQTSAFPTDTM